MSPILLTLDPIKCPSWTFNVRPARGRVYAKVPEADSYFHDRTQCHPVGLTAIFSEFMTLVRVLVMFPLGSIGKVCCRRGACQNSPSFRCQAIGHSPLVESHNSVADGQNGFRQIVAVSDGFRSERLPVAKASGGDRNSILVEYGESRLAATPIACD